MTRAWMLTATLLGSSLLVACAGKGEVLSLDLRPPAVPPDASADARPAPAIPEGLTVVVLPFEDARPDKGRLGARQHLGGGESSFDVAGGQAGTQIARAVAEYLKKKGWRAEVRSANPAATSGTPPADVTLSGKLLGLSADADSKFMRTKISVSSKLVVHLLNAADGSTMRMPLNGEGEQTVFWFEPEDVEGLLGEVLAGSLEKLVTETKVEGKIIH